MQRKNKKKCGLAKGCGYLVKYKRLHRIWTLLLLSPIMLLSLPVIAFLYLIFLISQGTPVFYKGIRLGCNQRPFTIYKFRTLKVGSEKNLKNKVLPARSGLETRFGKFFRDCRLDELPQLLNILKGDMNFIGPRPVRPDIAEYAGRRIKNYNIRFTVQPGLIGHTQLFCTHRTPKSVRSRFNAYFCRRKACFWKEPLLIIITINGILKKISFNFYERLSLIIKTKSLINRRQEHRFKPALAEICTKYGSKNPNVLSRSLVKKMTGLFLSEKPDFTTACMLRDINDEAFTFYSWQKFPGGRHRFYLIINIYDCKWIKASCIGEAVIRDYPPTCKRNQAADPHPFSYIIYYSPVTDFDFYKIDKYFLKNSIIT